MYILLAHVSHELRIVRCVEYFQHLQILLSEKLYYTYSTHIPQSIEISQTDLLEYNGVPIVS